MESRVTITVVMVPLALRNIDNTVFALGATKWLLDWKKKKKKTEPKEEINTNRLAINELNFSSVQ